MIETLIVYLFRIVVAYFLVFMTKIIEILFEVRKEISVGEDPKGEAKQSMKASDLLAI